MIPSIEYTSYYQSYNLDGQIIFCLGTLQKKSLEASYSDTQHFDEVIIIMPIDVKNCSFN